MERLFSSVSYPFKKHAAAAAFCVLCWIGIDLAWGHIPIFSPPPKPKGSVMKPTPTSPIPTGAVTPPQTPAKGAGTGTRVSKPMTRSSDLSWQHWWARNRFNYLHFPTLSEKPSRFPFTPGSDASASLNALKEKSIALFRPMLEDKSARLRRASLIGLARLKDRDSLPDMIQRLQDTNQTVRDYALLALGILDCSEAKHTLLHVARGTREASRELNQSSIPDYFRGFAEVSLAMAKTKGVGGILQSIAEDPASSPEIKAMALEGLGLLGGEESAKFLIDYLDSPKAPPEVLSSAAIALGKTHEPFAIPLLEKLLLHKCVEVQQSAALGLGRMAQPGCEKTVDKLYRCYKGTADQALKGFCLIAMGQVGGPLASKHLERALVNGKSSDAPWVCLGLGFSLRETPDPKKAGRLVHALKYHGNRSARGAAAIALGLIGYTEAQGTLTQLLEKGSDATFRGYCALAVGMIGDPASIPVLRKALFRSRQHDHVKTQAAMALALLKDVQSAPDLLEELFESKNDVTKAFIALALSYLGDTEVINKALEKVKKKTNDDLTLLHCIHLTSKLLSGETAPFLTPLAEGSNFASEYSVMRRILEFGI